MTRLDSLEDVQSRVESTIVPEPPLTLADGGVIREGIDTELDELRAISHSGRESIAAIEQRERERTGIQSLKGPVQFRLRLLHRDHQIEPGECARATTSASKPWSTRSASRLPS